MCYLSSITTGAKIVQISVICKSLTLFDFCLGHEFPKRWCAFDGELGESAFLVSSISHCNMFKENMSHYRLLPSVFR